MATIFLDEEYLNSILKSSRYEDRVLKSDGTYDYDEVIFKFEGKFF